MTEPWSGATTTIKLLSRSAPTTPINQFGEWFHWRDETWSYSESPLAKSDAESYTPTAQHNFGTVEAPVYGAIQNLRVLRQDDSGQYIAYWDEVMRVPALTDVPNLLPGYSD